MTPGDIDIADLRQGLVDVGSEVVPVHVRVELEPDGVRQVRDHHGVGSVGSRDIRDAEDVALKELPLVGHGCGLEQWRHR